MGRIDDVTIVYKTDTRGLDKAQAEFKKTGKQIDSNEKKVDSLSKTTQTGAARMESSIKSLGKVMAATFSIALVTGFGRAILNLGKEFTATMSRVQALTQATGQEFKDLENLAKELGETTQFSATQAAEAMGFLAQAGFKTNEILAALPGTLQLAAAGKIDLAQSADIATNVLAAFGLQAADLSKVNDLLIATTTNANVNIVQFAEAFKLAGPIAKSAGVDISEVAAIIGTLGNAGIQGSLGGTALRGVISSLIKPSKQAAETLERLGVNVNDTAGEMLPLSDIFEQLRGSTVNASDLFTIFGERAASAASVLSNSGAAIGVFAEQLEGSVGIAAKIAGQQLDNLTGDSLALKSAIEGQLIKAFEALEPTVRTITQGLTALVRNTDLVIKIIGAAAAGLIAYTTATKGYEIAARAAAIAQNLFNASLRISPIGAFAAVLATAVTALVLFKDELFGTAEAQDKLTDAQKDFNAQIAKEQAKLNTLIRSIKEAAKGSTERKNAIVELNKNYGKYIGFLVTEETTLEDLAIAQEKANKALIANIALKAKQAEIEAATTNLIEAQRNALNGLSAVQQGGVKDFAEYAQQYRFFFEQLSNDFDNTLGTVGTAPEFIRQQFEETANRLGITEKELLQRVSTIISANDEYQDSIKGITDFYSTFNDVIQEVDSNISKTADTIDTKALDAFDKLKKEIAELERQLILQAIAGKINIETLTKYLELTNKLTAAEKLLKDAINGTTTSERIRQELRKLSPEVVETQKDAEIKAIEAAADAEKTAAEKRKERNRQAFIDIANTSQDVLGAISQIAGNVAQQRTAAIETELNKQLTALERQRDNQLITEERYLAQRQIIEDQATRQRNEALRQEAIFKKNLARSEALIGIARAVVENLNKPFLIAAAAALGAAQLAIIETTSIPEFADGVIGLNGPGTETSDSILAKLSKGESVMTAKETRQHNDALNSIRAGTFNDDFIPKNEVLANQFVDSGDSLADNLAKSINSAIDPKETNFILRRLISSNEKNADKIVSGLKPRERKKVRKGYGIN